MKPTQNIGMLRFKLMCELIAYCVVVATIFGPDGGVAAVVGCTIAMWFHAMLTAPWKAK